MLVIRLSLSIHDTLLRWIPTGIAHWSTHYSLWRFATLDKLLWRRYVAYA